MNFKDIPLFPRAHYEIDVEWRYLETQIASSEGLDLDPVYQRAHVWSFEQQQSYIEYMLRGGELSRLVIINAPRWEKDGYVGATLVDGKQRLEAIRAFMRDELRIFGGHRLSDFTGHLRLIQGRLKWRVVALETEAEVLDLYLAINAGGTPHTAEELARVRALRSKS